VLLACSCQNGDAPFAAADQGSAAICTRSFCGTVRLPKSRPTGSRRAAHVCRPAADVFLGWTQAPLNGRYFYVRRLKDHGLADIGRQTRSRSAVLRPASVAAPWARAHARRGRCSVIIGVYIGDRTEFDKAIAQFAMAYAEQTTRDWHTLLAAIGEGKISAAGG